MTRDWPGYHFALLVEGKLRQAGHEKNRLLINPADSRKKITISLAEMINNG